MLHPSAAVETWSPGQDECFLPQMPAWVWAAACGGCGSVVLVRTLGCMCLRFCAGLWGVSGCQGEMFWDLAVPGGWLFGLGLRACGAGGLGAVSHRLVMAAWWYLPARFFLVTPGEGQSTVPKLATA